MTSTTNELNNGKVIHAARIFVTPGQWHYIFLRKSNSSHYVWYKENTDGSELETTIASLNSEEALRLAPIEWKSSSYTTLMCGFRYTLPERDEHGINALFHQMVASYSAMNGVYYDDELGNNCFVQNASNEACRLWKRLKNENRL